MWWTSLFFHKDEGLNFKQSKRNRSNGEYAIATKERAYLDTIYRSKKYYFDNPAPLNWDKVFEILPIYNNKKMAKTVQKYYEKYKAIK